MAQERDGVTMKVHVWSDRYTRKPGKEPTFTEKEDDKHTWPNYSIHPWVSKRTGRRVR